MGCIVKRFDNFIEGYINFDLIRPKKLSAKIGSGGISVFVKNDLIKSGLIKRIFDKLNECLTGHDFDRARDIILLFAYVAPEGLPIYTDTEGDGIEILSDKLNDIIVAYPTAELFLVGDFYSRIKYYLDYIPDDNRQYAFGDDTEYLSVYFNLPRNTKDKETYNNFGLSLIDTCCTRDIHVLNGRLFDDKDGNITCTANNGSSIVDYMIASSSLFNYITSFGVDTIDLSVHFLLYCTLSFTVLNQNITEQNDTLKQWVKYKWKP